MGNTTDATKLVGRILGRRYAITARIAQGGMAVVYRAHDRQLDRTVAVKVPRPEVARNRAFREQFQREVRAVARLSHPNVVAVYDSGEERGLPYVVMEHVAGQSLRDLLELHGRLDLATTAGVLRAVAGALDHAHRAGIAHLDVKPENILLTDEAVKVADFGLVRAVRSARGGVTAGTVQYLAPEVIRGDPVDGRADVYSLGVVAFECLTGQPPYSGPNPDAVLQGHLRDRVPPPSRLAPGLPAAVDQAVLRATDPDPERRQARATDLAAAFGAPGSRVGGDAPDATAELGPAALPLAGAATGTPRLPPGGLEALPPLAMPPRPVTGRLPRPEQAGPRLDTEWIEPPPPPRRPRRRRALAILALLALLASAGAAAFSVLAHAIAVPDVRGRTLTEARELLADRGLRAVEGAPVASRSVPEGRIARQSPGPLARVGWLTQVELRVSSGLPLVRLPDVSGRRAREATAALRERRLRVRQASEASSAVPQGRVIRTDPPAGTAVREGSTVVVVVSSGQPQVEVPDVDLYPEGVAREALERAGFEVVERGTFHGLVPEGLVVGTDPPGGSRAERGSRVTILVSRGPELVEVPDVIGEPREDAVEELREAGLRPQFRALTFGGEVAEQSVEPGTLVPRGTTVVLTLDRF